MDHQNDLYPISKVMDKILKRYDIEPSDDNIGRLRKAVKRFCEKNKIWDTHIVLKGERGDHYFTKEELRMIVFSPEIHKYVISHLLDQNLSRKIKELEAKADKLTEIQQQIWTEMQMEDDPDAIYYNVVVTPEEVRAKKLEIMIEALFLRYFTPVDTEKLKADMEEVACSADGDIWPETITAMERLANGRNYYEEK